MQLKEERSGIKKTIRIREKLDRKEARSKIEIFLEDHGSLKHLVINLREDASRAIQNSRTSLKSSFNLVFRFDCINL